MSCPYFLWVKTFPAGRSAGAKIYTNLDPSGNPTRRLRLVASWPTADCRATLGPSPVGGFNIIGNWGTQGLMGSKAIYCYFGIWPPKSEAVMNDWLANPFRMVH